MPASTPSRCGAPDLLIAVTDAHIPPGLLDEVPMIELTDLSETEAVDRLIDRFEGTRPPDGESVTGTMRYPGDSRDADRHPADP